MKSFRIASVCSLTVVATSLALGGAAPRVLAVESPTNGREDGAFAALSSTAAHSGGRIDLVGGSIVVDSVPDRLDPRRDPAVLEQLRLETLGHGLRVLRDGEVLSGRVLAEGIILPAGARVGIMPGTEIISSGPIDQIFGTFVPLSDEVEGPVRQRVVEHPDERFRDDRFDASATEEDDVLLALEEGGIAGGVLGGPPPVGACGPWTVAFGNDGGKPATISMVFTANAVIDIEACTAEIAGGPLPVQLSPTVVVHGAPSARAIGGRGGDGADIEINVGRILAMTGTLRNGVGAPGGSATAIGADATDCGACGGHAEAVGGEGGAPGRVTIDAGVLVWDNPAIVIRGGGDGGVGLALGGDGGNCDDVIPPVCASGGDGGQARAKGGAGGELATVGDPPNLVEVLTIKALILPMGFDALRAAITVEPAAEGGLADASGGLGGNAGPCPCTFVAVGGHSGGARSLGGRGAVGFAPEQLIATVGYPESTRVLAAGDGGRGGDAIASTAFGGRGSDGQVCPCSEAVTGPGGAGGWARGGLSIGGPGGNATGSVEAGITAIAGAGGDAYYTCATGGVGGRGSDCKGPGSLCVAGSGGQGGGSEPIIVRQGRGGLGFGGAGDGDGGIGDGDGVQLCPPGPNGDAGLWKCEDDPCGDPQSGDCFVANETPGCDDFACCVEICGVDPFCCDVAWDSLCVDLAAKLCKFAGTPCFGDLNGDGVVDADDLGILLNSWGPCPGCPADLNGDGVVDIEDYTLLLGAFGPCP